MKPEQCRADRIEAAENKINSLEKQSTDIEAMTEMVHGRKIYPNNYIYLKTCHCVLAGA